jgi:hypothetical protein
VETPLLIFIFHTTVTMSSDKSTHHPPSHVSPNFLDLPREIRDLIYHEFWRSNPALPNFSQRFLDPDQSMYLRYEGSYEASAFSPTCDHDHHVICSDPNEQHEFPLCFLASKQLLSEALEQFLRRAEWFSTYNSSTKNWAPSPIMPDASSVEDVNVYVGALPPLCYKCDGGSHLDNHHNRDCTDHLTYVYWLANCIAEEHEMGRGIRRLRIIGSTRKANDPEELKHALLALLSWSLYDDAACARAERMQLSLWHEDLYEIGLYDIVDSESGISVILRTVDDSK